jgi:eukaryotic-like serine/threonine-protein kinase
MSVTEVRKSRDPDSCSGPVSEALVLMAERQAFTGANHSLDRPIGSRVGRYTIRECLGVGGMGEVYRADDSVLKRSVALKRITPRASGDPMYRERLLREAERASSISNQHMAAVYDVLEEERELYLVMEYVEGETLRRSSKQPLEPAQFFHFARQCAEGLAAAHARGILHCDLKPENIIITPANEVKILDFGLAKTLPHSELSDDSSPTTSKSMSISGTPAYMSPEILMEQPPDQRSDIFSMGVVFYEVLAGANPFRADTFVGTTDRILRETPPPIRNTNPTIPAAIEQLVFKMIAKLPDQRYASAKELLHDLNIVEHGGRGAQLTAALPWYRSRVVFIVMLIVLALAIGFGVWRSRSRSANTLGQTRHVAVLPFRALDSDPNTQAFSSGLTETLTTKLGSLPRSYALQVVPPAEIRTQHIASAQQARGILGVNMVIEGSLQQSGNMMRINYNLVDAQTLRELRAGTITARASDAFSVEDQVVDSVLNALDLELHSTEKTALANHGTTEPAAYDFYLRGRGYLQDYERPENVDSAIEVFQHALERDPNYALAYAGLGQSYQHKFEIMHDANWVHRAEQACQRSVSLAPNSPAGYACLGAVYNQTGQYERAVEQAQHALSLDPNDDDTYRALAFAYEKLKRFDDAEATYRESIALRPQYAAAYNWLGSFLYTRGRYTEAIQEFRQSTELAPDNYRSYYNLGGALTSAGRYEDAIPPLQRSIAIRPNAAAFANLGTVYFYLGKFPQAAQAYEKAVELDRQDSSMLGNLAEAYYWIPGKREQAQATYRAAISQAEKQLKINPREVERVSEIGIFHGMLGDAAQAKTWTARALGMDSSDPYVLLNASLIAAHFGQDQSAIDYLRRAIDAGVEPETVLHSPTFNKLRSNPEFQSALHATAKPN